MSDLAQQSTGRCETESCRNLARVLLVDDREADVYLARKFLGEPIGMRCRFRVAYTGHEGLDIISQSVEEGDPVDLVLVDINMPGMDGFELLERIRGDERTSPIPVVICSTSDYDRDKARAAALGALGYLEKPARLQGLLPIIERTSNVRLVRDEGNVLILKRAGAMH